LIYLDVEKSESAIFIRRLLKHPEFNTQVKRMGNVIRVSHAGLRAGGFMFAKNYISNGNDKTGD